MEGLHLRPSGTGPTRPIARRGVLTTRRSTGLTAPRNPHRARLAARLRALRADTGLSGNRLAQQLGWPQPRVSKLEIGKQIPSEDDLTMWLTATGASDEQRAELAELLSAARIEYATWRGVQRTAGGLAARHAERAVWEAATTSPLASAMDITEADADAMVAERIKRQDILYQPGRTVHVLTGETALRNTPSTADVLLNQLDRLISFAWLPSVELGIVPHDVPMPIAPLACFTLFDDDFVLVETLTGEQRIDDPARPGC
ncbi:MAG: helix-turn-helix domain-containing protein [Pseudonocardiaceae bacterium]|nr:helix-turn-helix domain-containing protein [Pseudonocardiaceae bacterium]